MLPAVGYDGLKPLSQSRSLLLLLLPPFFSASAVSSRFPAFTLYLSRPISSVIVPPFISSPLLSLSRRRDSSSVLLRNESSWKEIYIRLLYPLSRKIITIRLFYSGDACLLSLFECDSLPRAFVSSSFRPDSEIRLASDFGKLGRDDTVPRNSA